MALARRHRWTLALGLVAGLIVALVLLFDWNWFKPTLEARAGAILHRRVQIANLRVALLPHLLHPRVDIDGITVPNPDGFPQNAPFATIKRIALTVDLRKLLGGTLRMDTLDIVEPRASMADNAKGQRNWDFSDPDKKVHVAPTGALPEIGTLTIENGDITMRDRKLDADLALKIATRSNGKQGPEIVADGKGRYTGQPFALAFHGASLLSLRDQDKPYPFYLKTQIGPSTSVIDGDVSRPLAHAGYRVNLQIAGPSLSQLFPIIGIPAPLTPPYTLKGELDYEGTTFKFTNFSGKVGDSDLAGNLVFKAGDRRPELQADLTSNQVKLADLKGLIGSLPGRPENEDKAPAGKGAQPESSGARSDLPAGQRGTGSDKETAPVPARRPGPGQASQPGVTRPGKMLPDIPLDLAQLRAVDARVTYRGKRVYSEDLPIDNVAIDVDLKDGHLKLMPVRFGVGKGQVSLNADIDGNHDPAVVGMDVDFRQVDVHRLMKQTGAFEGFGTFGGRAALKMRGNSVADMLGGADGELVLLMSGGSFSALLDRLAELDLLKSIGVALSNPHRQIPVRCMVSDMPIQHGVMTMKTFVFDTSQDQITGAGTINLHDERFDLRFTPHPKSPSIGVLRAPIEVKGPFNSPSVMPDPKVVGLKAAAAAALGVVLTPLGALIPTIELGLGKDSDCRALIEQARQAVPAPAQQSRR